MNKKTHIPEIRFQNYRENWREKTLKNLSNSIEYGLNSSATYFDGVHKYVRITDIDDNSRKFISEKVTSPDIEFTPELENFKLQKNDLLFARTGASVGKTYLYDEKDGEMYYAGFLIRARIKEDVSADFIFQQTLTEKYKQ